MVYDDGIVTMEFNDPARVRGRFSRVSLTVNLLKASRSDVGRLASVLADVGATRSE